MTVPDAPSVVATPSWSHGGSQAPSASWKIANTLILLAIVAGIIALGLLLPRTARLWA